MKKKILLMGALLLALSVFAQDGPTTSASKHRPGIKLGLAFSTIDLKNPAPNGLDESMIATRKGLILGAYYRIRLTPAIAFQPEFQFIFKGWRNTSYHSNEIANYIELPLNLLFTSYGKRGSTFYLGGGPAPAVNLNDNSYFSSEIYPNQFDLGINLLAGFEIPIGFALNVNYTHGLLNFNENGNGPDMKNRCFGLTLGYTF